MKKMHILLMSFAIIPLLILGCGKPTNPVDVPFSEDSGVSSLAKGSPFDMHDEFATEGGASGSGTSDVAGGSVEIEVKAEGLAPNHNFEVVVTIDVGPPGPRPPVPVNVLTFPVQSDGEGEVEFKTNLDLVGLKGPGTYRLDFFFTHPHTTDTSESPPELVAAIGNRDPLLACRPAARVTVPEDN